MKPTGDAGPDPIKPEDTSNIVLPKTQPWKSMKSLEEDTNPDLRKLNNYASAEPTGGSTGASVSKPMDRKTEYEGLNE